MIKCIVNNGTGALVGPFPISFLKTISALSGRKNWKGSAQLNFEATSFNLRKIKESGAEVEFDDQTGDIAEFEQLESHHTGAEAFEKQVIPAVPLRDYQKKALELSGAKIGRAHV